MATWEFVDYVSPAGTNLIEKWFRKDLAVSEESDLTALLKMLQKQEVWGTQESLRNYEALAGAKYQGLAEIRLPGENNIPMRLIGFRDPDLTRHKFTFLIGCRHKGRRGYDPVDCLDTAVKRKKLLTTGEGSTCEHTFDNDEAAEEK